MRMVSGTGVLFSIEECRRFFTCCSGVDYKLNTGNLNVAELQINLVVLGNILH